MAACLLQRRTNPLSLLWELLTLKSVKKKKRLKLQDFTRVQIVINFSRIFLKVKQNLTCSEKVQCFYKQIVIYVFLLN